MATLREGVFLVVVGLIASGCASIRDSPKVGLSNEDEAILMTVLEDPYLLSAVHMANRPFLRKWTELNLVESGSIDAGSALKPSTGADFVIVTKDIVQSLSDRNHSRADLRKLPLPAGWSVLLDQSDPREPEIRRIVTVSLPGLSPDGLQALVAVQRDYNRPCCPEGYFVFLEREGHRWVIRAHGAEWIV